MVDWASSPQTKLGVNPADAGSIGSDVISPTSAMTITKGKISALEATLFCRVHGPTVRAGRGKVMVKRVFKVKMPPNAAPVENPIPVAFFAAGLDVHKYNITACVATREGLSDSISRVALQEFKNNPRGLESLLKFLAKYNLQAVVMEATGGYSTPVKAALDKFEGWSRRPLVIVFNPTEVHHFPGELHEDKADAFAMARYALKGLLRASFIPDGVIRELRDLTREASILTKESTRAKGRIKRVLAGWGLALLNLELNDGCALDLFRALEWSSGDFGMAFGAIKSGEYTVPSTTRKALANREAEYASFITVKLPPVAHIVLRGYVLSLAAIEALIDRLVGEVEDILVKNPATAAVVDQIAAIEGIAAFTAVSIVAEVGDITRFRTVKQFLSYAGCAPSTHQSGTKIMRGRLTKRANPYLKRRFFWIGMSIATNAKGLSDNKTYADAQRARHPAKRDSKLVWVNTGAKVARIVYAILRTSRPYEACHQSNNQIAASGDTPTKAFSVRISLRDLRRRAKQFVRYLNRFRAEAPAKFQAVAEAFEKIAWAPATKNASALINEFG